jgi:hypothetical protein
VDKGLEVGLELRHIFIVELGQYSALALGKPQ